MIKFLNKIKSCFFETEPRSVYYDYDGDHLFSEWQKYFFLFSIMGSPIIITLFLISVQQRGVCGDHLCDERNESYSSYYRTLKIEGQTWIVEDVSDFWHHCMFARFRRYEFDSYGSQESKDFSRCFNSTFKDPAYNKQKNALDACPIGWHVPNPGEFKAPLEYKGDDHDKQNDCSTVGELRNTIFGLGGNLGPITAYCDLYVNDPFIHNSFGNEQRDPPFVENNSLILAFIVRCIKD